MRENLEARLICDKIALASRSAAGMTRGDDVSCRPQLDLLAPPDGPADNVTTVPV
jgi:hypothetical protein